MQRLFDLLLILILSFVVSCQSRTDKMNEVLDMAIQMNDAQNYNQEQGSGRLPIQNSPYTGPIKEVPSQEDLIKEHKVKTVKDIYSSGWLISTYDRNGRLIKTESHNSSKKTYSYKFDDKGRIIKERKEYDDGTFMISEYVYNEKDQLMSKSIYFSENEEPSEVKFEYDEDLNTCTEISSVGNVKEFYDNRGLRVRFESYDEYEKLDGSGEAKYDKNGLKISETASLMGMNVKDKFEYNEKGQLLKQHRTGMVVVTILYEYDAKGLLSSYKNIQGSKVDETRYEYTYY